MSRSSKRSKIRAVISVDNLERPMFGGCGCRGWLFEAEVEAGDDKFVLVVVVRLIGSRTLRHLSGLQQPSWQIMSTAFSQMD